MKRFGNLYNSITSFSALLSASRRARKRKRFKTSTARFEYNLERELITLEKELHEQTYRPGPYREFFIYEPKPRKISAAPYRDRVAQHALCHVIEPIFERSLIFDTYACRVGKGTHKAVDRFSHYSRKFNYVLKCDIKKYFPSIDHQILKNKIQKKIKCSKTLWLVNLIIDSSNLQEATDYYFPGDDLFTMHNRRKGIPIGNLTSQLFANLYLNDLDHLIKERFSQFGYLRYMDDMALFGNDKQDLWNALKQMESFLNKDRLLLKANNSLIYPVEQGVNFLGYKIYPSYKRIRYENVVRYRRRLKKLNIQYGQGKITFKDVHQSLQSWIGHVGQANSWRLRNNLFNEFSFKRGGT